MDETPYIRLGKRMRLFCETVALLSADLYTKIDERMQNFSATCDEIISLAQKFEKKLDWEHQKEEKDYIEELEKFEQQYLSSVKEEE